MKARFDGRQIEVEGSCSILEAGLMHGVYIPHLCAHPDLDPMLRPKSVEAVYQGKVRIEGTEGIEFPGCGLCVVEIEGESGVFQACKTMLKDGMEIRTNSAKLIELRRARIARILESHPHACLICAQSEGCDRKLCSSNVPENERCCFKFGACELQKVAEYIGIEQGLPPYKPLNAPIMDNEPVITTNYNLCIGCIRCVRVCDEVKGAKALGFTVTDEGVVVGTLAPGLKESGCKFCGLCIEICPTGALAYSYERKKPKKRGGLRSPVLPPEKLSNFSQENILKVPEVEGVYFLYDEERSLYKVAGVENLGASLLEDFEAGVSAKYFSFEEDAMFTARERQVIQQHIAKTGKMPPGNEDLDDLF